MHKLWSCHCHRRLLLFPISSLSLFWSSSFIRMHMNERHLNQHRKIFVHIHYDLFQKKSFLITYHNLAIIGRSEDSDGFSLCWMRDTRTFNNLFLWILTRATLSKRHLAHFNQTKCLLSTNTRPTRETIEFLASIDSNGTNGRFALKIKLSSF